MTPSSALLSQQTNRSRPLLHRKEGDPYRRWRIAQTDPDLAVLADLRAFNGRGVYCTHLRQGSLALASLPQAGAGRMPLGINIGESERAALLAYLENLAGRTAAP
jgi:hypothetical protein